MEGQSGAERKICGYKKSICENLKNSSLLQYLDITDIRRTRLCVDKWCKLIIELMEKSI